jgi:hypothetical protein
MLITYSQKSAADGTYHTSVESSKHLHTSKISISQGGEYEDKSLLRYSVM